VEFHIDTSNEIINYQMIMNVSAANRCATGHNSTTNGALGGPPSNTPLGPAIFVTPLPGPDGPGLPVTRETRDIVCYLVGTD